MSQLLSRVLSTIGSTGDLGAAAQQAPAPVVVAGVIVCGSLPGAGGGSSEDANGVLAPPRIDATFAGAAVAAIAASSSHSLVASSSASGGNVLGIGNNANSQLGDDLPMPLVTSWSPLPMLFGFKIVSISCGLTHSLCLDDAGKVYAWGDNSSMQCGHGERFDAVEHFSSPMTIDSLSASFVIAISAGHYHSGVITTKGSVYTWGKGDRGALGHANTASLATPKRIKELFRVHTATSISCGANFTAIATSTAAALIWGAFDNGRLGLGNSVTADVLSPRELVIHSHRSGEPVAISTISCGYRHAGAVSLSGEVFTWGSGLYGELGHGQEVASSPTPRLLGGVLLGKQAKSIHCGMGITGVVLESGQLYTFGSGQSGRLGSGSSNNESSPYRLATLDGTLVSDFASSLHFSIAAFDNGIKSQSYAAFARDLKAYLYTLQLMQEVLRVQMAPLLSEQQIDIVFGTLDGVVAATRTLAQQLFCSFAVRRKGIRVITSALAQFLDDSGEAMLAYMLYVSNYPTLVRVFGDALAQSNQRLRQLLQALLADPFMQSCDVLTVKKPESFSLFFLQPINFLKDTLPARVRDLAASYSGSLRKKFDRSLQLSQTASAMVADALSSGSFAKYVALIQAHKENSVLLAAHRRYLGSLDVLDLLGGDSTKGEHRTPKTLFLFNDLIALCDRGTNLLEVTLPIGVTFVKDTSSNTNDSKPTFQLFAPSRTYYLIAESDGDTLRAFLQCVRSTTDAWLQHEPAAAIARQRRCYELLQENMAHILPWLSTESAEMQGVPATANIASLLSLVDKRLQDEAALAKPHAETLTEENSVCIALGPTSWRLSADLTVRDAKRKFMHLARSTLSHLSLGHLTPEQMLLKVQGVHYYLNNEGLRLRMVPWIQVCFSTTMVTPMLELVPRVPVYPAEQEYDATEATELFEQIAACLGAEDGQLVLCPGSDEMQAFRRAMADSRVRSRNAANSTDCSSSSDSTPNSARNSHLLECIGFEPVIAQLPPVFRFHCTIAPELLSALLVPLQQQQDESGSTLPPVVSVVVDCLPSESAPALKQHILSQLCNELSISHEQLQAIELSHFVLRAANLTVYLVSDNVPLANHDYIRTCVANEHELIKLTLIAEPPMLEQRLERHLCDQAIADLGDRVVYQAEEEPAIILVACPFRLTLSNISVPNLADLLALNAGYSSLLVTAQLLHGGMSLGETLSSKALALPAAPSTSLLGGTFEFTFAINANNLPFGTRIMLVAYLRKEALLARDAAAAAADDVAVAFGNLPLADFRQHMMMVRAPRRVQLWSRVPPEPQRPFMCNWGHWNPDASSLSLDASISLLESDDEPPIEAGEEAVDETLVTQLEYLIRERDQAFSAELAQQQQEQQQAHTWNEMQLFKLTSCARCTGILYAMFSDVRVCSVCNMTVHAECVAGVPPTCSSTEAATPTFQIDASCGAIPSSTGLDQVIYHIQEILDRDTISQPMTPEERGLIFKFRKHFSHSPQALSKILSVVDWCNRTQVREAHLMLTYWEPVPPAVALELLLFTSPIIRKYAVSRLKHLSNNELFLYLLQLVQAVKVEPYHDSALARFLIDRSVANPDRIGHFFFWYLKSEMYDPTVSTRFGLLIEAYLRAAPSSVRAELVRQVELVAVLTDIALHVKSLGKASGDEKTAVLRRLLRENEAIFSRPCRLPLDPRFECAGFVVDRCRVLGSKTVPLFLAFATPDPTQPPRLVIFKIGDDLHQDVLMLQVMRIFDSIWKAHGLDFKLKIYDVHCTGKAAGMIDVVTNSATTSDINMEAGMLATTKDDTLTNWIRAHNASDAEFANAIERFKYSCAGYCVIAFLLGLADRHNDNIMMTKKGHLFHIDFGHSLGHYRKLLGLVYVDKSDTVFMPQYVHVLGGLESANYKSFVALCSRGYNILRKSRDTVVTLFALMLSSGLKELASYADILFLYTRFRSELSDDDASAFFTQVLAASLAGKTLQVNHTFHVIWHGLLR